MVTADYYAGQGDYEQAVRWNPDKIQCGSTGGAVRRFCVKQTEGIGLRQYKLEEYENYLEILFSWYKKAYEERKWREMSVCRIAIQDVPNMIAQVRGKTGLRSYRIEKKPNLSLNRKYIDLIIEIGESTDE